MAGEKDTEMSLPHHRRYYANAALIMVGAIVILLLVATGASYVFVRGMP